MSLPTVPTSLDLVKSVKEIEAEVSNFTAFVELSLTGTAQEYSYVDEDTQETITSHYLVFDIGESDWELLTDKASVKLSLSYDPQEGDNIEDGNIIVHNFSQQMTETNMLIVGADGMVNSDYQIGENKWFVEGTIIYGDVELQDPVKMLSTTYGIVDNKMQSMSSGTDVKVDGNSITSNNEANLITINGDYNASTNKLATANDLPDISTKMDKANPTGTGSLSLNRQSNTTVGTNSVAVGGYTTASGDYSHAEGYGPRATGFASHAEGSGNAEASGNSSHAEGAYTLASGDYSHAENCATTASGQFAHAEGYYTTAQRKSQHTFGEYNVLDTTGTTTTHGTYIEIVGNGTANNARSNARTLDWSGNEWLAGKITPSGGISDGNNANYVLQLPDTTNWTADKIIATTDQINTIAEIAEGKTANYVISNATTGTNVVNTSFNSTQDTVAITISGNKITDVQGNDINLSDLKVGDIVSITETAVPDRWVGSIASSVITFYKLEIKLDTDSAPTSGSTNPVSSGGVYSNTVSDITYDSTNKKLKKTKGGTTSDVVTFGANAFNSTTIPTSYVSSVNGNTGAITNVAKTNVDNNFSSNQTITGTVTATTFNAVSDKRLKKNIKKYIPKKSILDLEVKEFDFKYTDQHDIGCIAQELQKICPEIVKTSNDGYLSIEENKLVYLLLEEVKKLKRDIEKIKGE